MRWLVTGSRGMLGTDVVATLRARGYDVTAAVRGAPELSDLSSVTEALEGHDVVVNCAAWTAVDEAESREAEALHANAVLPDVLARSAARVGARLVHLSTDYVFDGTATSPYAEDAPVHPTSAYGRTKAAGEEAVRRALPEGHLVVRTAWLYGEHGRCFPRTIARLAAERGSVQVVTDQRGQPTWTVDVAELVVRLVESGAACGTFHATSSGACSWHEFAEEVVASAGLGPAAVEAVTGEAFPRPAPRPSYSVLGHDALLRVGVEPIGDWRDRWRSAAPQVLRDV